MVLIERKWKVISEEIILTRDRVECIANELFRLLKVDGYYQFKLRFSRDGAQSKLVIIPHAEQVDITI